LLFASLSDLGDFARYVASPTVRDFTDTPSWQPRPKRRRMRDKRRACL